ncbi:MAG TPA: cupredoxin domain-containing protein, partial [Acidimicrobiales bacterium]|nr:cupredoxin domain-containing protein [Acidimicrobiales bacterium]
VMAACGSDGDAAVVELAASDDACVAEDTTLDAGKTTFRIHNEGDQVTEVYVYAPGDRVVTERESIGPGTSTDLTVSLAAGDYELACKPGQKGDGIRQAITVTGEGGEALPEEGEVEIHLTAVEYAFEGLDDLGIHAGETVMFEMRNSGEVEHEFEVFGPDGEVLGEVGPTAAGDEGKVVLTLDEAGTYRYVCGIDDHEDRGMAGTFEVE